MCSKFSLYLRPSPSTLTSDGIYGWYIGIVHNSTMRFAFLRKLHMIHQKGLSFVKEWVGNGAIQCSNWEYAFWKLCWFCSDIPTIPFKKKLAIAHELRNSLQCLSFKLDSHSSPHVNIVGLTLLNCQFLLRFHTASWTHPQGATLHGGHSNLVMHRDV